MTKPIRSLKVIRPDTHQISKNGLEDLPPSIDDKFWVKDSKRTVVNVHDIPKPTPTCGEFRYVNPYSVQCNGCQQPHLIPNATLDHEGNLVRLDNKKIMD